MQNPFWILTTLRTLWAAAPPCRLRPSSSRRVNRSIGGRMLCHRCQKMLFCTAYTPAPTASNKAVSQSHQASSSSPAVLETVSAVAGRGCKKSGTLGRKEKRKILGLARSLLQPCSLSANRVRSARGIEGLMGACARSSLAVGEDTRKKVFGISPSTKSDGS